MLYIIIILCVSPFKKIYLCGKSTLRIIILSFKIRLYISYKIIIKFSCKHFSRNQINIINYDQNEIQL